MSLLGSGGRRRSVVLLAVTVLVVATNLRAPITSVGPVLDLIAADTGLSPAALGVLGAIPVLAFAAVSPLVDALSRRLGAERAVLVALVVLIAATVVRSLPGWPGALWLGTVVIGAAIAVGTVLVPSLVRRDFPNRIAQLTGAYSAVLSIFAATASGLALPIAAATDWRVAIGIWALLSVLAAGCWLLRLRSAEHVAAVPPARSRGRSGSMWTSPTAWQVALFMGLQSYGFYFLITWLPSIEIAYGIDPVVAGWNLFGFQAVGVVSGLAVTAAMHGRSDLRVVAAGVSATMATAMTGLALLPQLNLVWILLAGLSSGASLVVALSLVALRARNPADTGRLSGMVQSVGYLIAASGPFGAGVLLDLTGRFTAALLLGAVVASGQLVLGLLAGRDRYTHG